MTKHVTEALELIAEALEMLPSLRGPPGEKGDRGEPGATGAKGDIGPQGSRGEEGPQGPPGPQGQRGEQGVPGPEGPRGDAGPHGERGEIGPQGPKGPVGPQGSRGERGERGETGMQGPRGESAVPSIVRNRLRHLVKYEVERINEFAGEARNFLPQVERFYRRFEMQLGDAIAICGAVNGLAHRHVERSKERLLAVSGSALPENLALLVANETANWLDVRGESLVTETLEEAERCQRPSE